jgi:hypothetical protein
MKPVIIVPRPRPAPKLVNAMYVNVGKVNHIYVYHSVEREKQNFNVFRNTQEDPF